MFRTKLLTLATLSIVGASATQVIACGHKFKPLNNEVNSWSENGRWVFQDDKVWQAIVANKKGVMLPESKGVFLGKDSDKHIQSLDRNEFAKNYEKVAKNDNGNKLERFMQLQYVGPSMIYYAQKRSGANDLLTYDDIIQTFNFKYEAIGSDVPVIYAVGEPSKGVGSDGFDPEELKAVDCLQKELGEQNAAAVFVKINANQTGGGEYYSAPFKMTISINDQNLDNSSDVDEDGIPDFISTYNKSKNKNDDQLGHYWIKGMSNEQLEKYNKDNIASTHENGEITYILGFNFLVPTF